MIEDNELSSYLKKRMKKQGVAIIRPPLPGVNYREVVIQAMLEAGKPMEVLNAALRRLQGFFDQDLSTKEMEEAFQELRKQFDF